MISNDDIFFIDSQTSIFSCGLLLPFDQEACAIEMFKSIDRQNPQVSKFQLNKATHPPYVRLYETVLSQEKVAEAYTALQELMAKCHTFKMTWGQTERTQHFVAIWGEPSPSLNTFHQMILDLINPLREGHFKEKYIEDRNEHLFSSEEEASFEKWGSPWADPYVPHMIIDKAHSPQEFSLASRIPEWDYKDCLFRGLLVGVRNEHGDFLHSIQLNFA
jgi:hypothetical protein